MNVLLTTLVWLSLLAASATPSPSATKHLEDSDISPGLVGFLATFGIVVVTVLLIIDMSRRVRRLRYRQRLAQEEAARRAAARAAQESAE